MGKIIAFIFCLTVISMLFFACPSATTGSGYNGGDRENPAAGNQISYNGNGNTGGNIPVDTAYYQQGDNAIVMEGSLLKINVSGVSYRFVKWNTRADGKGTDYDVGQSLVMGNSDVILYARWTPYALRDIGPAGGWIFYDKGSFYDGWRYLEAAPGDQSGGIQWYNGSHVYTGATETLIDSGKANTAAIISAQGSGNYAARICNDLVITTANGVYDDWFLPSLAGVDAMYWNLAHDGIGGFSGSSYYWSSTETDGDNAYRQNYFDGQVVSMDKREKYRIRATRAF